MGSECVTLGYKVVDDRGVGGDKVCASAGWDCYFRGG